MSFAFPPKGWAACDGQLLPINQNQALFSLLGTNYGGDGRTNFALPDLRDRTPIGAAGPGARAQVASGTPAEDQPGYRAVQFCIAVQGIFPSEN